MLPSRDSSLTASNKLERLKSEAFSVKQSLGELVRIIGSENISPTNLMSITGKLVGLKNEAESVLAHEDMDAYTQKELGRSITQDATLAIAKVDAVLALLKSAIPVDKNGFLLICKWDSDGTLAWPALTPAQLAEFRVKLQELVAFIE